MSDEEGPPPPPHSTPAQVRPPPVVADEVNDDIVDISLSNPTSPTTSNIPPPSSLTTTVDLNELTKKLKTTSTYSPSPTPPSPLFNPSTPPAAKMAGPTPVNTPAFTAAAPPDSLDDEEDDDDDVVVPIIDDSANETTTGTNADNKDGAPPTQASKYNVVATARAFSASTIQNAQAIKSDFEVRGKKAYADTSEYASNFKTSTIEQTARIRDESFVKANALKDMTADRALSLKKSAAATAESISNAAKGKYVDTKKRANDYFTSLTAHYKNSEGTSVLSSLGNIRANFNSTFFAGGKKDALKSYNSFKTQASVHEMTIPPREDFSQTFVVDANKLLFYEFVVKELDVKMSIHLRTQGDGGSKEEVIVDGKKYASNAIHKGSINSGDFQKVFVFVISNQFSIFREKTVLYRLTVVDPDKRDDAIVAAGLDVDFEDVEVRGETAREIVDEVLSEVLSRVEVE